MKGLLLKDWYMMKQYCRTYPVIAVAFMALSLVDSDNLFFVFYPCLLCGMIPVILLGYDERSGWVQYSGTMPYTKIQITMLVATGIAQAVKMTLTGGFILGDFAVLMLLMLTVSTLASSIPLPFIFKMGVEKGRAAYYVMIGFVCGVSVLISGFLKGQPAAEIKPNWVLEILAVIGIGTYLFSWYMSVVFYKKREIQ